MSNASGSETNSPSGSPAMTVAVAQTFKVVLMGDSGVGKTSLIHFYTKGPPPADMISTIGIDFNDIIITVRGVKVKLRVWDTAGQERFHTFTKQFFRGAHGVMLIYDLTSTSSFTMLNKWLKMITESGLDNIDMVLVGNKSDLKDEISVPEELPKELCSTKGCPHILTSARNGTNVKNSFYKMAELLVHSHNIFIPGIEAAAAIDGSDDFLRTGQDVVERPIVLKKEDENDSKSGKKKKCCNKN